MIVFKINRVLVLIGLILCSSQLFAEVYRCLSPMGTVEFRDSPCMGYLEKQEVFPLETANPQANSVREEKRVFKRIQNHVERERKKKIREEARLEKIAEKQFKKEERFAEKCERAEEKITDIEFELRMGCKVQRCNRLKRELSKQQSKQQQYCQAGN